MAGDQRGRQKKITEYGAQLQEKQKAKMAYGLRERQFAKLYADASKDKSQTGNTLLSMLETRLDNVLFRSGIASTRSHARQLVSHRHFKVNDHRVSVASIMVKPGDVIEPYKVKNLEAKPDAAAVKWLKIDKKSLKIVVERLPEENELPVEFDTQKIVQFYSR